MAFFILFLPALCFAEGISFPNNSESERVVDQVDIFSPQEEQELSTQILEIETLTTTQIAILTLPSLQGMDIFQYGMELTEQPDWQVGQDDVDNGLVLIIAPNERKYRFFTGYGLEGILPDIRLQQIALRYFPDVFKQQQYFVGVQNSLHDISGFLQQDPEIISTYPQDEPVSLFHLFWGIALGFFAFIFGSKLSVLEKKKRIPSQALGAFGFVGSAILPVIGIVSAVIAAFLFLLSSQPPVKKTSPDDDHWSDMFMDGVGSGWSSGGGFSGRGGFDGWSSFGGGDFGGGGFGGDW